MNEITFIVSEPPESGYAGEALGQSIFAVADTLEECMPGKILARLLGSK